MFVFLTGGVNIGLICFSNIIPKLYRLIHGTDFNFLTVVILFSGLIHNSFNRKIKQNKILYLFLLFFITSYFMTPYLFTTDLKKYRG